MRRYSTEELAFILKEPNERFKDSLNRLNDDIPDTKEELEDYLQDMESRKFR